MVDALTCVRTAPRSMCWELSPIWVLFKETVGLPETGTARRSGSYGACRRSASLSPALDFFPGHHEGEVCAILSQQIFCVGSKPKQWIQHSLLKWWTKINLSCKPFLSSVSQWVKHEPACCSLLPWPGLAVIIWAQCQSLWKSTSSLMRTLESCQ